MVDMSERLNEIDDVIYARIESYAAVFQRELALYVAEMGLEPGGGNPEVVNCTANYYPTQPQNSTKNYDLQIEVYVNGMGSRQGALHRPLDESTIRMPTAAEIDPAVMRSGRAQNRRLPGMLDARSSHCAITPRTSQINNRAARFVPCTNSYKYVLRLMSDTYISDQNDKVRGYWIDEEYDPDHVSMISNSTANAYGNSLGRPVIMYDSLFPAGAGSTRAVRCAEFDYIGPWRADDEGKINSLLEQMEARGASYQNTRVAPSHRRVDFNDLLFEQVWYPGE